MKKKKITLSFPFPSSSPSRSRLMMQTFFYSSARRLEPRPTSSQARVLRKCSCRQILAFCLSVVIAYTLRSRILCRNDHLLIQKRFLNLRRCTCWFDFELVWNLRLCHVLEYSLSAQRFQVQFQHTHFRGVFNIYVSSTVSLYKYFHTHKYSFHTHIASKISTHTFHTWISRNNNLPVRHISENRHLKKKTNYFLKALRNSGTGANRRNNAFKKQTNLRTSVYFLSFSWSAKGWLSPVLQNFANLFSLK